MHTYKKIPVENKKVYKRRITITTTNFLMSWSDLQSLVIRHTCSGGLTAPPPFTINNYS